jgi:hypothetical protein
MRARQPQHQSAARLVCQTSRRVAELTLLIVTAFSAVFLGAFPGSAAAIINAPPLVNPKPAVQIAGGYELKGSVDPYGLDSHYHFEYGTTTSYGTDVPVPDADAGSNEGFVPVSQTITGLQPETTYHFRLEASNSAGPNTSTDATFTTPANPSAPPPSNQFTVGTLSSKGVTAMATITVPGPGLISASCKDLRPVHDTAAAGGAVQLKLRLNGAGSKALRRARDHRLKLKVAISFLPTGGSIATTTKSVTFKGKSR